MAYFEEADEELLELARDVIEKFHPRLLEVRFGFAFRSEALTRKGFSVLASTSLVSSRVRVHLEFDYLVWVALPEWEKMDLERRTAVLDHEFCHCAQNVRGDWILCDHDVQEFVAVIERHGLWTYNLERLGRAVQECLPGLEAVRAAGVVTAAPASAFHGN